MHVEETAHFRVLLVVITLSLSLFVLAYYVEIEKDGGIVDLGVARCESGSVGVDCVSGGASSPFFLYPLPLLPLILSFALPGPSLRPSFFSLLFILHSRYHFFHF